MKQCQEAGVRVIVITGDSRDTAIAIARDVNIFGYGEVRCGAFKGRWENGGGGGTRKYYRKR